MKKIVSRGIAIWMLVGSAGLANVRAQQEVPREVQAAASDNAFWNQVMVPDSAAWNQAARSTISIALEQPSTSDYLLAIARAADANLLADATDFAPKSPPLSGQWQHPTSSSDGKQWKGLSTMLLAALQHDRHLTMRHFPTRTFLLWSEPDMAALGRAVASALPRQDALREAVREHHRDKGEPTPLSRAVGKYLSHDLQWDGRTTRDVPLSQLPPDLQRQVRDYLLPQRWDGGDQAWYRDDFWSTAVLHIPVGKRWPRAEPSRIQISGIAARDSKSGVVSTRLLIRPGGAITSHQFVPKAPSGPRLVQPEEPAPELESAIPEPEAPEAAPAPGDLAPEANEAVGAALDLKAEPSLQSEISLESNRRPLAEVVAQANRQSEAQVTVDDSVKSRLLTVRLGKMPQWEWMQRLSHLLGVGWEKTGDKSYAMRSLASALDAQVLRVGDAQWFRYWQMRVGIPKKELFPPQLQYAEAPSVVLDVAQELDPTRLMYAPVSNGGIDLDIAQGRLKAGIPVSELQPEQVAGVRHHVEDQGAIKLIEAYRRYHQVSALPARDIVLHLEPRQTQPAAEEAAAKAGVASSLFSITQLSVQIPIKVSTSQGTLLDYIVLGPSDLAVKPGAEAQKGQAVPATAPR